MRCSYPTHAALLGLALLAPLQPSQGQQAAHPTNQEPIPNLFTQDPLSNQLPICGGPVVVTPPASVPTQPTILPRGDSGSVLDLLIVYTSDAVGGLDSATVNQALLGVVSNINAAYANSQIIPRLRLVHAVEVLYTETGDSLADLVALKNGTNGLGIAHTLRNTYCADMVTLAVATGDFCGRAYIMAENWLPPVDFSVNAFSVVSCGGFVLAHELGHNMGCHHDRENSCNSTACTSVCCAGDASKQQGQGAYSFSYGHRILTEWRTIMSFSTGCTGCPWIPHFSNPNVLYDGNPTGISGGHPIGANNALTINNTRSVVANWRTSCLASGACCFSGTCLKTVQNVCIAAGGSYLGDGTSCTPNPCCPNNCSGNGMCSGGICVCDPGWTGSDCATPTCDGVSNCSGNGTCTAPDTCICDAGWTGFDCSTPTCDGLSNCSGHGTCIAPDTCQCDTGWTGPDCSIPPPCIIDVDCDDSLFCNGSETCSNNTCASGSNPCPGQLCDEQSMMCADCFGDADCSDGFFCTGVETCVGGGCQLGTPVVCDDSIGCTIDSCNESIDSCQYSANHTLCDNSLFCDGAEVCDPDVGCLLGDDPCPAELNCDEETNTCLEPPIVWYVDATVDLGDGSTWQTAFSDLQDALDVAEAGDEIWVASGIYKPTFVYDPKDARSAKFLLRNGVSLIGGFAGSEIARAESDSSRNVTILSGDLAGDDTGEADDPSRFENSYHVISTLNTNSSTILNGFTITGGYANDGTGSGGGLHIQNSTAKIQNCVFSSNYAASFGAGAYVLDGTPSFWGTLFRDNVAAVRGGAATNNRGSPIYYSCVFINNSALVGGAMSNINSTNPSLTNCLFAGNSAEIHGGAVENTNGAVLDMVGCTFVGNSAPTGGTIINQVDAYASIVNSTFSHNLLGGAIQNAADMSVTNSIFWGNQPSQIVGTADVRYTCIEGGWNGLGNINEDPSFVDFDGLDGIAGTLDDNVTLLSGSPAIDAGDNASVPQDDLDLDGDGNTKEALPYDLNGNDRFFDDPETLDTGVGDAPLVDLGAYEYFTDCNSNGVLDSEDIASGFSVDIDPANGIPDECDCLVASSPMLTSITTADGLVPLLGNRMIGLTAGDPSQLQAIRVRFVSLPLGWSTWDGSELWVTAPQNVCQLSGVGPGDTCPEGVGLFKVAGLSCDPGQAHFADWSSLGSVSVEHSGIVPDGVYEIQVVDETCDIEAETSFSGPLLVKNAKFGDIAGSFDSDLELWYPPDESVDIVLDVVSAIETFSNRPGNPTKLRADVEPCILDYKVNISDIVHLLDAFRGLRYQFEPGLFDCPDDPCG